MKVGNIYRDTAGSLIFVRSYRTGRWHGFRFEPNVGDPVFGSKDELKCSRTYHHPDELGGMELVGSVDLETILTICE
jgi:hypothetical protein